MDWRHFFRSRRVDWWRALAVVALFVFAFGLWWYGYIKHNPIPQWIWDLWNWKLPFRRRLH